MDFIEYRPSAPEVEKHREVKRRSKWSQEENELLLTLRDSGIMWADIRERLRGRTLDSCRFHYWELLDKKRLYQRRKRQKLLRRCVIFYLEIYTLPTLS